MRFCIVGAGAIGGFVGAKLALAGEDVTYIARGKNLEAINAKGMEIFYRDGREEVATTVKATDDYAEGGDLRRRHPRAQGAPGRRGGGEARAALPRGHRGDPDAERDPLLVLPRPRRRARRAHGRDGGPGRRREERHPEGAHRRLRGLSRHRARGPRQGRAHRGRPLPDRRAGRLADRARHEDRGSVHEGRPQVPAARQRARRDVAQALGQPHLQPDLRAHARHARRTSARTRTATSSPRR